MHGACRMLIMLFRVFQEPKGSREAGGLWRGVPGSEARPAEVLQVVSREAWKLQTVSHMQALAHGVFDP